MARSMYFSKAGQPGAYWRCGVCGTDRRIPPAGHSVEAADVHVTVGNILCAIVCGGQCAATVRDSLTSVYLSFPELDDSGQLIEGAA